MSSDDDLSHLSLNELFQQEAQTQARVLSDGLLALERTPSDPATLEACMRAAHSLKGAARVVDLPRGVAIAHVMEDCFVNAQQGLLTIGAAHIDQLLHGVDLLLKVAHDESPAMQAEIDGFLDKLQRLTSGDTPPFTATPPAWSSSSSVPARLNEASRAALPDALPDAFPEASPEAEPAAAQALESRSVPMSGTDVTSSSADTLVAPDGDRMLRVSANRLNHLLGLSGEALVEARWLKPFGESLLRVKRAQREASRSLDLLHDALIDQGLDGPAHHALNTLRESIGASHQLLGERLAELENFDRRHVNLTRALYDEALACRMRPFAERTAGYGRMVRDLARSLGKQARLQIVGGVTPVDRDILELLDAPLGHLLRNAIDHGIEAPAARLAAGKPAEGIITLEARHSAGMLQITISDDGVGVNLEAVRAAVVRRRLSNLETSERLSDAELLEFLFLPGFSMRAEVTDVSGRGVGLDVVQNMVRQVRGTLKGMQTTGQGTRFVMQLPLSLSVIRSLLVEIDNEPFAFPLASVTRALELPKDKVDLLEGQQHFHFEGRQVGLVSARQVLEGTPLSVANASLSVVVIGDGAHSYGLVVDRFLGQRMLVVQPLDARLGKIKDIAAGALMENGDPVLIVDVDDLVRSVEKIVSGGALDKVGRGDAHGTTQRRKHVLVVDDSLTVRELERKLLSSRGYRVSVAVDGMEGWNALRSETFDLVVTDVDMPRMDGIELVSLIRRDAALKAVPVLIVSYKDREEDRQRGLDAGADYYLAKGSFHDEALIHAVHDLIGEPLA
jgi:two-component system sensor histidine kinase and response regulator WspE